MLPQNKIMDTGEAKLGFGLLQLGKTKKFKMGVLSEPLQE
jgi:hypothetical protein